MSELQDALA